MFGGVRGPMTQWAKVIRCSPYPGLKRPQGFAVCGADLVQGIPCYSGKAAFLRTDIRKGSAQGFAGQFVSFLSHYLGVNFIDCTFIANFGEISFVVQIRLDNVTKL